MDELQTLLTKLRLEKFADDLKGLGVESQADLAYLEDKDLEKLGLPLVGRRKLLEAVGGQWRQASSAPAPAPVPPVPPAPKAAVRSAPEELQEPRGPSRKDAEDDGDEDLSEKSQEELQQLLRDLRNIREDFATVNCLDLTSRSKLSGFAPRVALRTMGLLGTGYSFFLEGQKKPASTLALRSANCKFKGLEPYEDWMRLLEGFVAANKLSASTKEALQQLSRDQALKVMGFTSGLRFLAGPVYRGEAELEVKTRLWTVQSDAKMVPVLPRGVCEESRSRSPIGQGRSVSAVPSVMDQFPHWKQHIQTFIELNELDPRGADLLRSSSSVSALHVIGLLGTKNTFLLRGAKNPGAVVATRLRQAATATGQQPFAQLAKLMEDFITTNRLSGEVAQKFRGLPREQALQVMGFAASDEKNQLEPFIIKDANAEEEVRRRMDAAR